jgi:hypothetical protein
MKSNCAGVGDEKKNTKIQREKDNLAMQID